MHHMDNPKNSVQESAIFWYKTSNLTFHFCPTISRQVLLFLLNFSYLLVQ